MHTVRNRLGQTSRKGAKPRASKRPSSPPPASRSSREDVAFMLARAAPPTFPADLIVPPHRGALTTDASWPLPVIAGSVPEPAPAAPNQRPMGRKAARRAERRAAAIARAQACPAPVAAMVAAAASTVTPEPIPEPTIDVPQTVSAERPLSPPDDPLPAAIAAIHGDTERAPALAMPPQATFLERPAQIEVARAYQAPLPSTHALVPRRQGFIDIMAFVLRDSGRRLARWSSARRRADDMKEKLVKAEARMRAMEAQLAALQALQEHVRRTN